MSLYSTVDIDNNYCINLKSIMQAKERIKNSILTTPIMTSSTFNQLSETNLYFKCENYQKTGKYSMYMYINYYYYY